MDSASEKTALRQPAEMSPYERKTWNDLRQQAEEREQRRILKPEMRRKISEAGEKASELVKRAPGAAIAEDKLIGALEGLRGVTMDAAMVSVSKRRVIERYERRSIKVTSLSDLRHLDLQDCDETVPHLRLRYSSVGAVEGAATSVAITGAAVATTVSGGTTAVVAIGAIAADVATVLAAMGRVVAETAAYYGYDLKSEDEQLFALAIIAYSSATTQPAKVAALAEISQLTQMMMRRATWATLNKEPLVKIIQLAYARLGLRLTQKGLSKAVPVAGAFVGAGMNAAALARVSKDAKFAYRLRFLVDKYGLDPKDVTGHLKVSADEGHISFTMDDRKDDES